MIDTHAHILKEYYTDIDGVLDRAKNNGINKIIISGCDESSIKESIELINKYNNLYATIGYHPDEALSVDDYDIENLKQLINKNSKIVGIGEIGLDYYYGKENKEKQIELFEKQLFLAEALNLPVVIHTRDAFLDTYNILKKYNVKGIIHCFSGSIEVAKKYIDLGFFLGIGGVITFKNSKLSEVIKYIDLNNIVLETDSPYLAPVPFRGKQNESACIKNIAEFICDIKDIGLKELDNITTNNTLKLFDLK